MGAHSSLFEKDKSFYEMNYGHRAQSSYMVLSAVGYNVAFFFSSRNKVVTFFLIIFSANKSRVKGKSLCESTIEHFVKFLSASSMVIVKILF